VNAPAGAHGTGRLVPSFPGALPSVWNVPQRNPNFTGRTDSLNRMREAMRSTLTVHSLRGMGGVGKTQLAIEYVHRFASDFDVVWWIPADKPELIPQRLAELGTALGVTGRRAAQVSMVATVLEALRSRQRWLLVFDNANDPRALHPFLPSGQGHILITTRNTGFSVLGAVLDVDVLDRAESVALLRHRLPTATAEQAETLAELLGDLPLAIEQASAYLEAATGLSVDDYVIVFRNRAAEVIGRGQVIDRQETLTTLWDLSLTALGNQNTAAVQLLDLLAWMAPEPVPPDLFTKHPDKLPVPLSSAARDLLTWGETVGALVNWFFVRRTGTEMTIAHRLLQQSMRARHLRENTSGATSIAVQELLAADLPDEITEAPTNWPRWRALLPHVLSAVDDAEDNLSERSAWLLDRAATYVKTTGRIRDARTLFERAVAIHRSDDDLNLANTLSNLGNTLNDLGSFDKAELLHRQALKIREAAAEPDQAAVADSLTHLGIALNNMGHYNEAELLHLRGLEIREAIHEPEHASVATSLTALGNVLCNLGRYAEARQLYERALDISKVVFGQDHPHFAGVLTNLGLTVEDLGDPAGARPLLERALEIDKAVYGPAHPTVANDLKNLGNVLDKLGHHEEAQDLFEELRKLQEPQ
jgi:tetratricopeptide (TPR) repeat protein